MSKIVGNPPGWNTRISTGPPEEGEWFTYEGHVYNYSDGTWWDIGHTDVLVKHVTTPFEFINEGVFSATADSIPYPVWGTNNQGDASLAPVAMAEHIDQMQGVLVMCYMDSNSSVSIPIRDHDTAPDGTTIYGDTLLDPAIPPIICFRHNVGSNKTTDIVTTPSSTTAEWSDVAVGSRGVSASNDRQFDVSVVLEKEPQPHWVLHVGYTRQATTTTTTFACWLVGCGAPTVNNATSWEVGTGSVAGHYKIYMPFEATFGGRQKFISDGAVVSSFGARRKFNARMMYWGQQYVAPGGGTPSAVYLTDAGSAPSSDVFIDNYPPCVFVYGDDDLDQNRSTTVANFQMTSWGIGFDVDGYLQPEDAALGTAGRSLQNPNCDEYSCYSRVQTVSSKWAVRCYNLCNTTNINGNARAPASGTGNRHYVVIAFGPDASTNSASTGNRYWSKSTASSTMTRSYLQERALWVARVNVYGNVAVVWWTDDGTSSGDNIFDAGLPLMVRVIASDTKQPTTFTVNGQMGPMIRPEVAGGADQFMWKTYQSGGLWLTEIAMGGLPGDSLSTQGDSATRQVFAYAMGLSA